DGLRNASAITVAVEDEGLATERHVAYVASLNSGGDAAIAAFTIALDAPPPVEAVTEFQDIAEIGVETAGGQDSLSLLNAPGADVVLTTIDSGANDDLVEIADASATTVVYLGLDNDEALIRFDRTDVSVEVHGDTDDAADGGGADLIVVEQVGGGSTTEVFGGPRGDIVRGDGQGIPGADVPGSAVGNARGVEPAAPTTDPDTLQFDPQNAGSSPNFTPAPPTPGAGQIAVDGKGTLTYDTFEGDVVVLDAPIISFSEAAYQTTEGQGVTLEAIVTPHGSTNALQGEIEWDLDGLNGFNDAVGPVLSLTWEQLVDFGLNDDGVYRIGVTATNEDGATAQAFVDLEILNVQPTLAVTGPATAQVGDALVIDFTATDPGDDTVARWEIDWMDGTPVQEFGAGTSTASHVFATPGIYAIEVTAFDEDPPIDGTTAAPNIVTINVTPADVSAGGPYVISEGEYLTLTATAAGAPSGFSWDVNGDGVFGDATGQTATLTWAQLQALPNVPIDNDGVFAASVLVSYGGGSAFDTISDAVTVTVLNTAPTGAVISNSGPILEGGAATVTISGAFDPSAADFGAAGENLRYSY
ncbi:MAG: PKD domain-containing protein, partial [Alphaproteobacteria bacterium]